MAIGENIKRLRESRGLTQSQLGDAIGVSDKAVSTWESGTRMPRMNVVDKLATFFGVDKRDLLFCDNDHFYRLPGGWGTPDYLVKTLMSDPPLPEIVKPILSYYEEQRGEDEVTRKLLGFVDTASSDELRQLLDFIAYLISRRSSER